MKLWRRPSFALLALLALFASVLPQALLACPMMGQIGTAATVCNIVGVAQSAAAQMPCAPQSDKCCKSISVPPQQSSNDNDHPAVSSSLSFPTAPFHAPAPVSIETPVVFAEPALQVPPVLQSRLARFSNSPPSFKSQHRPFAAAGRAPPVL